MAADILLYKTDKVPVGKDQLQHVELARSLARKFNQKYGKTFVVPEALLPKIGAKIMSLQDPKKKMSKTDNPQGYISLFDTPTIIRKKIMSAQTDPGKKIKYDPLKKPGISNLLTIYSLYSNKSIRELEKNFDGKGYEDFKKSLARLLVNSLEPFRRKKKELLAREVYVKEVLGQGQRRAQIIAQSTMEEVRKKMGLV
jgi:tryptophanyl-tRNA synthetase